MKNSFKVFFCIIITIFTSCEQGSINEDIVVVSPDIVGDCSNPLKVSEKLIIFDNNGGNRTVNVSSKFRITGLKYNGEDINSKDYKIIREENTLTYKHNDFTVQFFDSIITVTMNKNKGEERKLYIGIASGNCFSSFTVEQTGN